MANRDRAAALALLDKITPGEWRAARHGYIFGPDCQIGVVGDYRDRELLPFNEERWDADARAIAALPELAALYRAGVELEAAIKEPLPQDATPGQLSDFAVRCVRVNENFHAALAAVAAKLTGEGK